MQNNLPELAKLIRYYSLVSTTEAGSGHPTSSLSAADLMVVLMFGGFFRTDLYQPEYINNDRLIFSKGHASPLFYSLYAVAGQTGTGKSTLHHKSELEEGTPLPVLDPEEMLTLRKFGSRLEGHPTLLFPYTEVPTGSLGQGLSVGVGMALNAKMEKLDYRTFVLMGDSEVAEGSIWEAAASASFNKLDNLIGILDVNRLGQSRETMLGHHTEVYEARFKAFGWNTIVVDGHDIADVANAFQMATSEIPNDKFQISNGGKPTIIIAKTLKGKGVSFIEDKDGWHGKALSKEELEKALVELGTIDKSLVGEVSNPDVLTTPSASRPPLPASTPFLPSRRMGTPDKEGMEPAPQLFQDSLRSLQSSPPLQGGVPREAGGGGIKFTEYPPDKKVATRKAYGNILPSLMDVFPEIVVMDGETSNSTYSDAARKIHPDRYIEMFIAEQNMVGVALGLSRRGKIPFISTFAAFFSRAFDQIRMSALAQANIKFVGSHAGVSIGEDGASQMGLEELAMFRATFGSVVLYPSDALSAEKLIFEAAKHKGNVYIQTTRKETAILYSADENFPIGGSKTIRSSANDQVTVVGAGVTLHEALAAYEELKNEGLNIRVVDLYSIKPIDVETLSKAAKETKAIITVEDSYPEGGIGEAVVSALASVTSAKLQVTSLAVRKMPRTGKPDELLAYEEIDKNAIINAVKKLI